MRFLIMLGSAAVMMVVMFKTGELVGYQQGKIDALTTNPPNEELELVCAGLWVSEQNKEYVKRNAKK